MKIEIGIQVFGTHDIDLGGIALRNMRVAKLFADDGAVLVFRLAIVVSGYWQW